MPIVRLTLFKITDAPTITLALQKYASLTTDAKKDGKSYIQMAAANVAEEDTRNQGYALVARTVFASKEDMDFYDNECEAHGAIKALIKPKVVGGPPLVIYMDVKSEEVF